MSDSKEKPKAATFDLSKIIKKAQESYEKKEQGLARQITVGSEIVRPTDDKDFVVWTKGPHWQALTGLKGIPFSKIVQISGKPDSGKSTHAAVFMQEAQSQGHLVVLWDSERKFQKTRYEKMGGDPNTIISIDTNNIIFGAKAVAHVVNSAKEQYPDLKVLIVWDSVGACVNSKEDVEGEEDFSQQPGVTAKEVAWAVRKFSKLMNKHINRKTGEETIGVLVVNQTYSNFTSPGQTEKGGSELYYLSSLVIQLTRKGDLTRTKDGEKYKYGIISRAKVKKNHLFDGKESIAEMDIVVSADGIQLAKDVKNYKDIQGWGDSPDSDD